MKKTIGRGVQANAVPVLVLVAAGASTAAWGRSLGSIELQSTSYLRSSPDRFTNGAQYSLQYEHSTEGRYLQSKARLMLNGFASDSKSLTPELSDLYLSTSQKFSNLHTISVGRKTQSWSRADDAWALGAWSPRFMWDPLRPTPVGLAGLSYQYRSRLFELRVFGSPIVLPERGVPLRIEEGRLITANPDAAVPLESVSMLNQNLPIRYSIQMPSLESLISHSSAIAYVRLGDQDGGLWSSVTAGIKPMNVVDVSAEAGLKLQPQQVIEARLFPQVVSHRLATLEAGYQASGFEGWASLTREIPMGVGLSESRSGAQLGAATISSFGLQWRGTRSLRLDLGLLSIQEDTVSRSPSSSQSEDEMRIELPSRYRFKQSARVGVQWNAHERLSYGVALVRDFQGAGNWFTTQASYSFKNSRWRLGVGADLFSANSGTGFLSPYQGNDRFQGRLTYAF